MVDYVGGWVELPGRNDTKCSILTAASIMCSDLTIDVVGTEISRTDNTTIKGIYNGINVITWIHGVVWVKRGKLQQKYN